MPSPESRNTPPAETSGNPGLKQAPAPPTPPQTYAFNDIVLPGISLAPATEPLRVLGLNSHYVRQAINTWMEQLPISSTLRVHGNGEQNQAFFDVLPGGLEFMSRDLSLQLNTNRPGLHARGYINLDWMERVYPDSAQRFLGLQAREHEALGEVRVSGPRFVASVVAHENDFVAGAFSMPHVGSLFGSYQNRRWQALGEFQVDQASGPLRDFSLAFAASPDRQHLRAGLIRPGVPAENERRGGEYLCGLEFYRGPLNPNGAMSTWMGGEHADLSLSYDFGRRVLGVVGHAQFAQVTTAQGTFSLDAGIDTREASAHLRASYFSPSSPQSPFGSGRSLFRGFGSLGFSLTPDGRYGVNVNAGAEW